MKYEELNRLFQQRNDNVLNFAQKLANAALQVRGRIEDILEPADKTWKHVSDGSEFRYVDIVRPDNDRELPNPGWIREDGVLYCNVLITFDHGPGTYPKRLVACPIAIRFFDRNLQYAFFNPVDEVIDGNWYGDQGVFCEDVVQSYSSLMQHHPEDGYRRTRGIGFLADSR